MIPAGMTMTVLTHPLQTLLMALALYQAIRTVVAALVRVGEAQPADAEGHPAPVADPCRLRAA